jgi:formylglycine-generating enzyme
MEAPNLMLGIFVRKRIGFMNKALGFGVVILLSALPAWGQCPSADYTRDCFVDLSDFAVLAGQWLTEDPNKENQDLALLASQWLTGNHLPKDMVFIPRGSFLMGASMNDLFTSNERPVHTVSLDSFAMNKYEVTNAQFCAFLNSGYPSQLKVVAGIVYSSGDTANRFPYYITSSTSSYSQIIFSNNTFSARIYGIKDMAYHPMVQVTWYGAVAYCNWRSQQIGRELCYDLSAWTCDFTKNGYRLPTEAEWEYAARGGLVGKRFPWGDTISHSQANYCSSWPLPDYDISPTRGFHPIWNDGIEPYSSPVGSFPANNYGVCDMAGNVSEWCHDWYENYGCCFQSNPTGPATGPGRVVRGSSWFDLALFCHISYRSFRVPDSWGDDFVGFRVVLKP